MELSHEGVLNCGTIYFSGNGGPCQQGGGGEPFGRRRGFLRGKLIIGKFCVIGRKPEPGAARAH